MFAQAHVWFVDAVLIISIIYRYVEWSGFITVCATIYQLLALLICQFQSSQVIRIFSSVLTLCQFLRLIMNTFYSDK
jgi:hypothetical protein